MGRVSDTYKMLCDEARKMKMISGKQDGKRFSDGYSNRAVKAAMLSSMMAEKESTRIQKECRKVNRTTEEVTKELEETIAKFDLVFNRFLSKSEVAQVEAKKSSSKVRDAANKLGEGLAKIEKMGNFDKLEHYSDVLTKLADSLERISELENSGKLEKLISAMK